MVRGLKVALAAQLIAMLIFVGCSAPSSTPTAAPKAAPPKGPTGTLTVGLDVDPVSLDPPVAAAASNKSVNDHIFDPLIIREFPTDGSGMKLQPGLATSWKSVNDTTWEFKLRQGVKFHNGEVMDAEAVKFTIDRIMDPNEKIPSRTQFESIKTVEVVDPSTVRILTNGPSPTLLRVLTDMWIIPPKYAKEKGAAGINARPVGTGPFKFVEYVKDSYLKLEANTDYWGELPKIKELVFKPLPDVATRVNTLLSGGVDVAMAVPPIDIDRVNGNPGYQIVAGPSPRVYYVSFHTLRDSPVKNKKVRQALNYAVDKEAILKTLYRGYGRVLTSPLTPTHFGFNPNTKAFPYDPEKAKQLLAEAGYPNGFEINMGTPVGRYPLDKEAAQAIVAQLAKVGVKANLQVVEWGNYIASFRNDTIQDMHYFGWGFPYFDADATLYSLFIKGANVYGRYDNPAIVKPLQEARITLDEQVRLKNYQQVQEVLQDDPPWIYLYQLQDVVGISKKVTWTPRPDERIWFHKASIAP